MEREVERARASVSGLFGGCVEKLSSRYKNVSYELKDGEKGRKK